MKEIPCDTFIIICEVFCSVLIHLMTFMAPRKSLVSHQHIFQSSCCKTVVVFVFFNAYISATVGPIFKLQNLKYPENLKVRYFQPNKKQRQTRFRMIYTVVRIKSKLCCSFPQLLPQEYHLVLEFATPVLSMWQMCRDEMVGFGQRELRSQGRLFCHALSSILSGTPEREEEFRDKYRILYYRGKYRDRFLDDWWIQWLAK